MVSSTATTSSMEKWQALTRKPEIVRFFNGLFERGGVRVADTGEAFTCIHRGDHIELQDGLDEAIVDLSVVIDSRQVDALVTRTGDGRLDAAEQYRIVRTMFTPATRATLKNPLLSNRLVRLLSGVEELIHVHLRSPAPEEEDCADASHTLIYAAGQWLVIPGIHGEARRTFRITMAGALRYQRHAFKAMKAGTVLAWLDFWQWYIRWRRTVSTRP